MPTITGTSKNNVLVGTPDNDSISGLGGNDVINGAGGNDAVNGGPGNDAINGGPGTDTAFYSGQFSDYRITAGVLADGWAIQDLRKGPTGDSSDALSNVERLEFTNTVMLLNGGNTAPAGNDLTPKTNEDEAVKIYLSSLISDAGGDAMTIAIDSVTNGEVKQDTDDTGAYLLFTPDRNYNGTVQFPYTVTDDVTTKPTVDPSGEPVSDNLTDTGTVTITVNPVNDAPSAGADQTVKVPENIADDVTIATVAGSDVDQDDQLTHSITNGNTAELFEIDTTGAISLASGQKLDFETAQQHVLEVTVSDGSLSDTAQVTVDVGDVPEAQALDFVAANFYDNDVSVRLNNGAGQFISSSQPPDVTVGPGPESVALGDVDGDLDFVAANRSNTVSVRLNGFQRRHRRRGRLTPRLGGA